MITVAVCILTKDEVLASFLLTECTGDVRTASDKRSVKRGEMCIVDAQTISAPYPENTLIVIARKETDLPKGARLLLRPLPVGSVREALSQEQPILSGETRTVTARGVTATLSVPEWKIFEALYGACGSVLPRTQLLPLLGGGAQNADGLLTVYIYRLRRTLAPLGFALRTIRGEGYLLSTERKGDTVC